MLKITDTAIDCCADVGRIARVVATYDGSLASQMRRAMASVAAACLAVVFFAVPQVEREVRVSGDGLMLAASPPEAVAKLRANEVRVASSSSSVPCR